MAIDILGSARRSTGRYNGARRRVGLRVAARSGSFGSVCHDDLLLVLRSVPLACRSSDLTLYADCVAFGKPVLARSGGVVSFWEDQVATFAKRFEVVTFDHRGFGQSDPSRIGYTVERMAVDVIGLMDALGIKRGHVVGHSTGGAIAQTMAIEYPSRLASVVLSATWSKTDAYFRRLFGLRKEVL